ncbi:MAG: hypothetical protein NZ556_03890 [Fimbriimonadales bacterium]|nr:hypothetical protein [Fimbriimonadales bacterium]
MSAWTKRLGEYLKGLEFGERFVRRNPLYYPQAVRTFFWLQEASLEERKAFAQRRLETVLRAAEKTTYGRAFKGKPFEAWALLPKERVRGREEEFLTRPKWLTSHGSTGGTTGVPLHLYRSLQSVCYEQATYDYPLLKHGVNPMKARVALLRVYDFKDPSDSEPPFWKFTANGRKMLLSANHLCAKTVKHYVNALREFAPDVLSSYPVTLEQLSLLLQRYDLRLRIPLVIATSEAMSSEARRLTANALNAEVLQSYGAAERVAFAWSERPDEYWMFQGYGWVEFIPVEEDSETITYEIVGTGFWNMAMPLVRYRMGDLVVLPRGEPVEPILWGERPFRGVIGRQSDYLVSPEGAHLVGIEQIGEGVSNALRIQVIQPAPDFVRILVIPGKGFSEADSAKIMRNARRKLPQSMQLRLEIVEEPIRTPAGKAPYIIREFDATCRNEPSQGASVIKYIPCGNDEIVDEANW